MSFDIFKKRSKIYVDAFTNNAAVEKYFQIQHTRDTVPDWFKKLSPTLDRTNEFKIKHKVATLKHCEGFVSLFKKGLMLPLWADLIIETFNDGSVNYSFSAPETRGIDFHDKEQLGQSFNNYIHMKLLSPWLLEEKTGVSWMFLHPSWNSIEHLFDYHAVPGLLNFKYQPSCHVNLLLPKKQQRIELSAGLPMAQMIPMSEKEIVIKHHLISYEEFDKKILRIGYQGSWVGKYKKNLMRLSK